MRRNKIKQKYLSIIKTDNSNENKISKTISNVENKIIKCLISFSWIVLMLFWGIIPSIVLAIMEINPDTLSENIKYVITFINDFLFLALLIKVYYKTLKENFKRFFNKNFTHNLKQAMSYWLVGLGIMYISNIAIAIIIGEIAENEEAVRSLIDIAPLYMAFQIVIYAPITEELIFRKSIRDIFNNKWVFAIVSGIIFGGLHAITSISDVASLLYLIPYCSLGIAFGLLYYKSDNIFSTMVVHSIHNTLALILYLVTL